MKRLELSAHLGYLFTEVPLAERFAAARAAGFGVVELPDPYLLPIGEFASLCDANRLKVAQIGMPPGERGEKGIACLPGREAEFREHVEIAISYARAVGCGFFHPMSGIVQSGANPASVRAAYIANLHHACARAAAEGLSVIIEPIGAGTIDGYFLNHPDLAVELLQECSLPNLRLSFDIYHAAYVAIDPTDFVRRHGDKIAHIQIADFPDRHEPGTGVLDFTGFFRALQLSGYAGTVGLEYRPRTTTGDGLSWIDRFCTDLTPLD